MIARERWHVRVGHWFIGRGGRPLRHGLKLLTAVVLVLLTVMGVLVSADTSTYGWWIHKWWGPYAVAALGIVGAVGATVEIFAAAKASELNEESLTKNAALQAELNAKATAYDELTARSSAEIKRLRKENRDFFDHNLHALYDALQFDRRDRITAYEIRIVDGDEKFREIARYAQRDLWRVPGHESPPHHHRLLAGSLEQANTDDPCDRRWFIEDLAEGDKAEDAWCQRMSKLADISFDTAKQVEMKSRTLYAYCEGDDTSATTILLFESTAPKRFEPHVVRDITTKQRELIRYLALHRPPVPEGPG